MSEHYSEDVEKCCPNCDHIKMGTNRGYCTLAIPNAPWEQSYCVHFEAKRKLASTPQPDPKRGSQPVFAVVLSDILERTKVGRKKYGVCLETNNGRNALWDAYQEAIDLVMYLRQELLEQEEKNKGEKL